MTGLPPFLEPGQYPGEDTVERWKGYIEGLYTVYLRTVAHGNLNFRGQPVRCKYRPETFGKHYAFWHMMQEGEVEDDRHIDVERCRRVAWISWVIQHAESDERIRVFRQADRSHNESWVLWLHEEDYAVILGARKDYYMLRTAFMVKSHKKAEFLRDWQAKTQGKNG